MSYVMRKIAHCDACAHEWIPDGKPTHCSKCKSRKWNSSAPKKAVAHKPEKRKPKTLPALPDLALLEKVHPAAVAAALGRFDHDPKACRVYRCGLCAVTKISK